MLKSISLAVILLAVLAGCSQKAEVELPGKQIIATEKAPKAIGPYSQAVLVGETLYCSGQIAINPETGEMVQESIEAETRQVLNNLGEVLKAAGMDFKNVVRATVYFSDLGQYQAVNQVYNEYFSESRPARAAVEVSNLPKGAHVEISCIARKLK